MMPEPPSPNSGPTAARVVPLSDFNHASAAFANWRGQFEQLSRGRFNGSLRVVRGGLVRIVSVDANQRVLIRGHDAAGLFSAYPVTDANAASTWHGRRLAPGQLVALGADTETEHYSARRAEYYGVSIRPEVLEDAARVLLSADAGAAAHTWAAHSPSADAFAALTRHLARLLKQGLADATLLGTAEGDRLEQACVRSLVAAVVAAPAAQPRPSLPGRTRLVRTAEEYMRARLGAPVGSITLCRELGASDRTLRLAFRERYGLGPLAFFKILRLNAVRSRLRAGQDGAVADVAREFGFHHLGNFAADYRRLFGERPSETPRG